MAKIISRVIKQRQTVARGRRKLSYAPLAGSEDPASTATITEEDGQFVIEVTCRCGERIRLRCAANG
jgi:hypothetical protein